MLERLSSQNAPKAIGSYSPASRVDNLIFTSGQLGLEPTTGKLAGDDITSQATQAMNNLKAILEDNGSSLAKIVKTTVYLSDIADFASFDKVYQGFFAGQYPARTAFQVGALPMAAKVEVEVVALIEE
ncbi:Rid family detoxifying hydrolase [Ligilactobacillus sp. Marseille-Q7487]|uniref:Rid family detoxifying hydrolase n=1 Tax=Ligilactobacillus sp. Marseille-Q7487 TaxID=3022128 RepID=UPI0024A85F96|nr:Rid family detoxifying hydrolase [Ligilactobacillus sp. Marseille-Q7487]